MAKLLIHMARLIRKEANAPMSVKVENETKWFVCVDFPAISPSATAPIRKLQTKKPARYTFTTKMELELKPNSDTTAAAVLISLQYSWKICALDS
jgi:hypothetical protein